VQSGSFARLATVLMVLCALLPATATGLSWFLTCTQRLDENKKHANPLRFTVATYRRFTAS
jgi:hypothetical protein